MAPATDVDGLNGQLDVAAEHATLRVPVADPLRLVGVVRRALVGGRYDCVDDVAALDAHRLVGLVPIERLLAAPADARIEDVMEKDPPVVAPGADREQVAWSMVRRGESSVAVVHADGTFAGLIPPHRMLAVLLAEHGRAGPALDRRLLRDRGAAGVIARRSPDVAHRRPPAGPIRGAAQHRGGRLRSASTSVVDRADSRESLRDRAHTAAALAARAVAGRLRSRCSPATRAALRLGCDLGSALHRGSSWSAPDRPPALPRAHPWRLRTCRSRDPWPAPM